MNLNELRNRFVETFGNSHHEINLYFAPGRINLIGEHIDYNGGFVFPAAITLGTYAAVTRRNDGKVWLYSKNFAEAGLLKFDLLDLKRCDNESWSVYVKGVIEVFSKAGHDLQQGFNAYVEGTIPNGAGLSSSASLEVLIGVILEDLHDLTVSGVEKAKLAMQAENAYVGVNCGIMDQFAIAMGRTNQAIKLNTNDLSYEYAPCDLLDYQLLIMNTNKRRELADSKYNERRTECDVAKLALGTVVQLEHLCDLTMAEFNTHAHVLVDEILLKRARHAVTENIRVKQAVDALASGDLAAFGELLNQSHDSLRKDYCVTGIELDTIVALAKKQPGVLGARMTGAGFGGCAIALVHQDKIEAVRAAVALAYAKKIGYEASFYVAQVGDGAKKLVEVL